MRFKKQWKFISLLLFLAILLSMLFYKPLTVTGVNYLNQAASSDHVFNINIGDSSTELESNEDNISNENNIISNNAELNRTITYIVVIGISTLIIISIILEIKHT